jgi:tellurite resistance protein TerC
MTVPAWVWEVAAAALIAVVAAEIAFTSRAGRGSFTTRGAITWVGIYVSLAVIFGLGVGITAGWVTAGQFYAGYLTEYSLSLDNLFIFYVIMGWFAVPAGRQHRVLLLGIGLALALRSVLIVAGAAALNRFGWLFYPLGGILLWTAIGLVTGPPGSQPDQHTRLMPWLRRRLAAGRDQGHRPAGRLAVSPMLLLVVAIGLADVLFAVDSIPAVFGITTSALLVVACNAFALMGLRQLYALLARVLDRIVYLNTGLGIICGFIGVKLVLRALRDSRSGWAPEIPAWLSVIVVAVVLLITVLAGMIRSRRMMEHVTGSRAPVPAVGGAAGYRIPPDAEEQAVLERRFAVLDIDGNGVWQWDDYQRLTRRLCEAFGHAADSAAGQAVAAGQHSLFDALLPYMDADGDQEITQDEFIAAVGRTVSDRAGFAAAVRTPAPSSKWLTRTVTERWTPGSTPGWPRCTVPQRRRPHRPSAGLTGTATACWTPRSSASSSPAGTPALTATSPSATCDHRTL